MPDPAVDLGVDFERPPLNEVVFSVQFESDVIDEVATLAEFWPAIREAYPRLEKQPPLAPVSESFDAPLPQGVQFQLLPGPPTQRYWFLSTDGTKIVQVQSDRFMFNWRQVEGDEPYPRYETLRPEFEALLETFLEHAHGSTPATWCELQYVNPIPAEGDTPGTPGQLARILKYLEKDPERHFLPPVEDTQIQQRFRIVNDQGDPVGRLYLIVVPAFHQVDLHPAYVLTLLARGRPAAGPLSPGVVDFLDRAHDLIVNGFKEVTTSEMHAVWGIRDR